MDSNEESKLKPAETQECKRRKAAVERTVVTVKIGENGGKMKNEGPPSDSWSWRKYGQKPIKGSPYPRGYYKCSTSKGCSAKKQVERCKTDASLLIITYTSSHNHPGPDLTTRNRTQPPTEPETNDGDDHRPEVLPEELNNELPVKTSSDEDASEEEHFQDIVTNQEDHLSGNLSSCPNIKASSSTPESDENDFFDELEELCPYVQLSLVS